MGNGFVSVKLDKSDAEKIVSVLKTIGIDCIEVSKLHVTVIYDESNPEITGVFNKDKKYKATVTGIKRLGTKGSKWEAIAFELKSPELEKRHKELKDLGFKHSYPQFLCHMSLVYKPAIGDMEKIELIQSLKGFPKTLTFSSETAKPIKD